MKKIYLLDTNLLIRFFMNDDEEVMRRILKVFEEAVAGKTKLILEDIILLEAEYVLRKVYSSSRTETAKTLLDFVFSPYISVTNPHLVSLALDVYTKTNIDLVDILLYLKAKDSGYEVLSFDKDFQKLAKLSLP